MAKKLIDQDEASRALGITLEALNSLRDRGKLYPKRDGGVWKYDQEDIERYQREMNEGSGLGQSWESISLADDISLEDNPDSVLLSEAELGESSTGKSTIIGRNKNSDDGASDIRLAGDSDLKLKSESASGTKPGLPAAGSSDLNLLSSNDDELNLAGDSKISFSDDPAPSGTDASKAGSSGLFDADEFNLEPLGSSLSNASDGGKSPTPNSSGSFKLDGVDLLDDGSDKNRDKSGDTAKGAGSSLQLEDDDELVLDGGHGSDITMSAADSGIMLVDPADSGLSLENAMTLGGGEELTIDEDDMITLEEQVDVEGATQLRTSEDFALTPTMGGDDDSDSGSQVIALDSEDDMSGAGMFGGASSDSLLSEDSGFGVPMDGGMGGGVGLAGAPVAMQVAAYPEAPYSVWNVIGLICCTLLLMTGGIMVYDLAMNIWSWDKPVWYNSSIMDSLLGMFEK